MKRRLSRIAPLAIAFVLCDCGAPQPPQCRNVPRASRVPADSLLASARRDWAILASSSRRSEWPAATARYNDSVAKLFDQLRCGRDPWNERAAALGTTIATDPGTTDLSRLEALFPAHLVDVDKVLKNHNTTVGLGVPLVGWKETAPVGHERAPYLLPNGLPYSITATLSFDGGTPAWRFHTRWIRETTTAGTATHPLAADWSAANAFYWRMCELDNLKLQNVFLPGRFKEETNVFMLGAYDPARIPVVFVHGLVSSPDAFKNMINELAPQPWFRENYQIWLFNYPTGNPWIYSSMMFREKMRATCDFARSKGGAKTLERMVVVSHSMGGLLTRSSVSDPGTAFYDANFKQPIEQLKVAAKTRTFIRNAALYQPLGEPERVVFCAVPHKGSPMATFRFANLLSKLIRLPKALTIELLDSTLQAVNDAATGEDQEKPRPLPTSINSLSPQNRNTKVLGNLPLPRDITFHSIIGDRGKGDTPDSSDGVVPYWSSHVESTATETIVPCDHSVPDNAEAGAELKRILKLHLQSN